MGFRCGLCGTAVPAGQRAERLVLVEREKEYPARRYANLRRVNGWSKATHDPGGRGFEIQKEVLVCSGCS